MSTARVAQTVSAQFSRALGLDVDTFSVLEHLKGVDRVDDSDFTPIFDTLWPATGDYYFANVSRSRDGSRFPRAMLHEFGERVSEADAAICQRFVLGISRTQLFPSVARKSSRARIRRAGRSPPTTIASGIGRSLTGPRSNRALFKVLDTLHKEWKLKATETTAIPSAGDGPDPDAEILGILGMAPRSQNLPGATNRRFSIRHTHHQFPGRHPHGTVVQLQRSGHRRAGEIGVGRRKSRADDAHTGSARLHGADTAAHDPYVL